MSRIIFIFFVLNIYTVFYGSAQNKKLTLNIKGKTTAQTKIIDSIGYTNTFNQLLPLKASVDSLTSSLLQIGYVDLETSIIKANDSTYNSLIELGTHYKRVRLFIPKNSSLPDYIQKAGIDLKNDSIIIETAFAKAILENLTTIASNSGNPFTSFQIRDIKKEKNNSLSGLLQIKEDSKRYADKIVINGYDNAPKGFIKHYARIREGKPFNQKELIEQNERLNSLSFITSRKDPEVLFTKDSTSVYFYLERKTNNRFDGFLGFATDEETNRLRLDGYVDLILTNNLNYGETLLLNYKSDGEDQTQLNINAKLPYLFKSPLGIETQFSLFRKDTTFSENSQEVSLFYQLNPNTQVSLGYKSKQSENLLDSISTVTNIQDFTQKRLLAGFQYTNRRSNYFFPIKTAFSIKTEIGNRETDIEKENQFTINTVASHIFSLNNRNQIFVKNTTQVLSSETYVTNELFRFGGITSIRGFEENSIFANLLSVLNTEYRYVLNSSIYVHSIIDLAYFENETTNQKEKLVSFGIGSGLRTKAGIFKINLANGKTESQPFRFSNTKLHFQLAIRF